MFPSRVNWYGADGLGPPTPKMVIWWMQRRRRARSVLGFGGAALALFGLRSNSEAMTFVGSKLSVVGIISTVGLSMFPFILPSSIDPNASLTVWNASSSHTTLFVMLIVTAILLPIVLAYTSWAFRVMWGRVTTEQVESGDYY